MTFEEEEYKKLNEHDVLWKYLDFHKFIDLISNKTLHFTRLDQFEDPFEGVSYELIAKRHIAKLHENSNNDGIPEEHQEAFKENIIRKPLEEYKIDSPKSQKSQFVNCWNKLERESMAMWDLYSNSNSIAIKLNGRRFIDTIKAIIEKETKLLPKHIFAVGSIYYKKINPPDLWDNMESPCRLNALKKDVSFSHEEEYRLVISSPTSMVDNNPKFHKIKVYESFFDDIEIICHPKMEDWKFKNIECICKKFHIKSPQKSKIELNF